MKKAHHKSAPLFCAVLFCFLLSPNLLLYFLDNDLEAFALSLLNLLFLFAALRKSKYWLLLIPFTFLLPLYWLYILQYRAAVSEQLIGIVAESNPDEIKSYVGYVPPIAYILGALWIGVCGYIAKRLADTRIVWRHWSWWAIVCLTPAVYTLKHLSDQSAGKIPDAQHSTAQHSTAQHSTARTIARFY